MELGLIIGGAILFVILLLAIIIFAVRSRPSDGYVLLNIAMNLLCSNLSISAMRESKTN